MFFHIDHSGHAEVHQDNMKESLLRTEEGGGAEEIGETPLTLQGKVLKIATAFRNSYIFELLSLPPVMALTTALLISFIPPLRTFLMTSYAQVQSSPSLFCSPYLTFPLLLLKLNINHIVQVIPNTATFIGDASIPIILMILGSNLADTSKDARVPKRIITSVTLTRLRMHPHSTIFLVHFPSLSLFFRCSPLSLSKPR